MNGVTAPTRIQMLQSSLRCFALGLMSLLPLIGLPLALFALMAFRRVILLQRGQWNPARPYLIAGFWCAALSVLGSLLLFGLVLTAVIGD